MLTLRKLYIVFLATVALTNQVTALAINEILNDEINGKYYVYFCPRYTEITSFFCLVNDNSYSKKKIFSLKHDFLRCRI